MREYVADFETLACDKEKTHVHTWGVMNQKTKKKEYGNSIAQFIAWCNKKSTEEKTIVWFHNLKFDGIFCLDYIERYLNMKYNANNKNFSYSALIDGMGNFYSIEITFKRYKSKRESVVIYDSAKRIPNMSVEDMAKKYQLPIRKGNYDYMMYRPEGHIMTEEEKEYLDNDLEIVGAVLDIQKEMGIEGMTIGSSALEIYKNMVGKEKFKRNFPVLEKRIDDFIRNSYNGGFTYVNKKIKGKVIGEGFTLDVNSLYPYVMSDMPLPYGMPIYYKGRHPNHKDYPLYVQQLKICATLKKNHIPTVQLDMPYSLKRMKMPEYAEIIDHETITVTNVDLEMIVAHYDITLIEYIDGYMFKSSTNLFKQYVDHWTKVKIKASEEGNIGYYQTSKLLLNSLYGKFGSKMERINKIPVLSSLKDCMSYNEIDCETVKPPIYTAIASFVTAYGRMITISASQTCYDRHLYSDTDSLHLSGTHYPEGIPIHKTDLGKWKDEGSFQKAKYIRQKSYIQESSVNHPWFGTMKKYKVACSGMKDEIKKQVTFSNFYVGSKFDGARKKKVVKGGVVLIDSPFTV